MRKLVILALVAALGAAAYSYVTTERQRGDVFDVNPPAVPDITIPIERRL